jgi:hypothetical protein
MDWTDHLTRWVHLGRWRGDWTGSACAFTELFRRNLYPYFKTSQTVPPKSPDEQTEKEQPAVDEIDGTVDRDLFSKGAYSDQ